MDELFSSISVVLGLVSVIVKVNTGSAFELFSSATVVLVLAPRAENDGSAFELISSIDVVPRLVSGVAEVKTGCGSGVITALGVISGISDRFVSPMLLVERALTIIITATTTHIIAITVIETVVVVAVVMVFIVMVDAMALAVVVVAAAVVHTVDDIDPEEPVNMLFFFAFECTQETPQSV